MKLVEKLRYVLISFVVLLLTNTAFSEDESIEVVFDYEVKPIFKTETTKEFFILDVRKEVLDYYRVLVRATFASEDSFSISMPWEQWDGFKTAEEAQEAINTLKPVQEEFILQSRNLLIPRIHNYYSKNPSEGGHINLHRIDINTIYAFLRKGEHRGEKRLMPYHFSWSGISYSSHQEMVSVINNIIDSTLEILDATEGSIFLQISRYFKQDGTPVWHPRLNDLKRGNISFYLSGREETFDNFDTAISHTKELALIRYRAE